jgi:hypothetical protein
MRAESPNHFALISLPQLLLLLLLLRLFVCNNFFSLHLLTAGALLVIFVSLSLARSLTLDVSTAVDYCAFSVCCKRLLSSY